MESKFCEKLSDMLGDLSMKRLKSVRKEIIEQFKSRMFWEQQFYSALCKPNVKGKRALINSCKKGLAAANERLAYWAGYYAELKKDAA